MLATLGLLPSSSLARSPPASAPRRSLTLGTPCCPATDAQLHARALPVVAIPRPCVMVPKRLDASPPFGQPGPPRHPTVILASPPSSPEVKPAPLRLAAPSLCCIASATPRRRATTAAELPVRHGWLPT
ncbi:hypothetical protein ZWY2020_003476 [Hordeum vulgare]|nr:hypothetical protein ZWY2020_003476 [Hordeum vulgare]